MLVLGIDIGSSFIKSSILDPGRGIIGKTYNVPTPDFIDTQGNIKEIPIDALAYTVRMIIDEAMAADCPDGIIISSQMHGYILMDEAGKPTGNYISWQDMRGLDYPGGNGGDAIAEINARIPPDLLAKNGVTLKNNLSLVPLYCARQKGEIRGKPYFAMLGDALIRLLSGSPAPIHPTMAASTGLYDLTSGNWNKELIKSLGLEEIIFPRVYDGKEPVTVFCHGSGKHIPIYAVVGDNQAAILGSKAGEGSVVLNIGTGGQICYIDKGLRFGNYETRPYFNGMSLRVLPQLPSGRSLSILMDFMIDAGTRLFGITDCNSNDAALWDRVNELAEQAEGEPTGNGTAPLSVDMDFFSVDSSGGGSIKGIKTGNLNAGSLFYGAYSSMANEYRASYERLFAEGEGKASMVVCTGGVLQKTPLLVKMIGKCFDIPCVLASSSEDVMSGLMRLADWYTD